MLQAKPMLTGRSAPAVALIYALGLLGVTALMPLLLPRAYPSSATLVVSLLWPLVVVAVAFGVYRRYQLAAWALVACAVIEVGYRVFLPPTSVAQRSLLDPARNGYFVPGIFLFIFALDAALVIRREAPPSPIRTHRATDRA
jgi:hypothetical protein